MKQILAYLFLTAFCIPSTYAQKLTLTDLTNLCNKKNWEDINETLLAKNWTYYESAKGDSYKYSTITWSYNKDHYTNKAHGWFHLYTYEGYPNKISYSIFNKESYSLIQNSIASTGFKLTNSEIENNEITSTYANTNYTLLITTAKRDESDYFGDNNSITSYLITLIKKAGIYDPNNGKKTDYYDEDVIKAEYTLLNGKINGIAKTYHYNQKLNLIGNFVNGEKNGLFKEYDELGNLVSEYTMSNGELNGEFKVYYSNGNLKKVSTYIKGLENGNTVEYDEFGTKEAEYTIANGVFNGSLKTYHTNGKLKKSGTYLNGKENGYFVEYNEQGIKEAECIMANGTKNGVLTLYKNGTISSSTTFKNDIKNGEHLEYIYDEKTNKFLLKIVGNYINDEKDGAWKLFIIEDDNKERLLTLETYTQSIKNGAFQTIEGDSIIIGSYKNDKLHGDYKVYIDFVRTLMGGTISTDTSRLVLLNEGGYIEGVKSGYWKNYDFSETLRSEGRFLNGQETGEWKYYHTTWADNEGKRKPYSRELYLIQNYSNGQLDGKSTRYSYINLEKIPCSEIDQNKNPLDTCKKYVYGKILETAFYKKDKLNGPFELRDSMNEIEAKGFYRDDLKDGEWLQRYTETNVVEGTNYFIYQKGNYTKDKREGKWVQYYTNDRIAETFNYKNGVLHGEYVKWNQFNKPREKKQFNDGRLVEVITYDSLGVKPVKKYEIYDEKLNSYKCRSTEYLETGYSNQEYWLKKDKEINHHWFILSFLLAIDKKISGESSGYKDGDFNLYNTENKLIVSGKYFKENRIGLWRYYYEDQNVEIEINYDQNKVVDEKYFNLNGGFYSGEFIYIDNENQIKEERKIKDGLRNGKTIYIDMKTKKTIKKETYKNGELKQD